VLKANSATLLAKCEVHHQLAAEAVFIQSNDEHAMNALAFEILII
jgi:hypothetical protein